jgi:hypothetical protein
MPVIIEQADGSFKKKKLTTEVSIQGAAGEDGADGFPLGWGYFLLDTASSIAGYSQWVRPWTNSSFFDNVTGLVLASGVTLIEEYATNVDDPAISFLRNGVWRFNFYYYVDTIGFDTRFTVRLYKRAAAGTETLLFESLSPELTVLATITLLSWDYDYTTDNVLNTDDRLVLKIYASTSSTSAVEVRVYGGATNASVVETQVYEGSKGSDGAAGSDATLEIEPVDGLYRANDAAGGGPTGAALTTGYIGFFDDNIETEVVPGVGTNDSIGLDFGAPVTVQKLRVYDDGDEGAGIYLPGGFDSLAVYRSDDNLTWTLVQTFDPVVRVATGGTNNAYYIDLELTTPASARYWKSYANSGPVAAQNGNSVDWSEIRAYGFAVPTLEFVCQHGNTTIKDIKCQNLYLNYDGPQGDAYLFFYDATSPEGGSLKWDEAEDRFEFSNDLIVFGDLGINGTPLAAVHAIGTSLGVTADHLNDVVDIKLVMEGVDGWFELMGSNAGSYMGGYTLGQMTSGSLTDKWAMLRKTTTGSPANNLEWTYGTSKNGHVNTVQLALTTAGVLTATGAVVGSELRSNTDIYVNYDGPDGDSSLYFREGASSTGARLYWDNTGNRFILDKVSGAIVTSSGAKAIQLFAQNSATAASTASTIRLINSTAGLGATAGIVDLIATRQSDGSCDLYLSPINAAGALNNVLILDGSSQLSTFSGGIDVTGEAHCNSLRIDQTPTAFTSGFITPTEYITVNLNGTDWRIPVIPF